MCSSSVLERNLEHAVRRVQEAAEGGADIVALPENFAFMGTDEQRARAVQDLHGEIFQTLQTAARENSILLLGGSFLTRHPHADDPRPFNTAVLFDRQGNPAGIYHKVHLFDVVLQDGVTYAESDHIRAGDQVVTLELEGLIFGLTICYDLRFPELYRALAMKGAQIVFVPAAFTLTTGKVHWLPLLQARAIENQMYVVAPGQFGQHDDGRKTYGHTAIVDPWGTLLAQASDRECVIYADYDAAFLEDVRAKIPVFRHRRPELY